MRNFRFFIFQWAGIFLWGIGAAVAAENIFSGKSVEERLRALEEKNALLERRWEVDQETAAAKAKDAPVVTAGKNGFILKSKDGDFSLRVRGYMQGDGRFFIDDKTTNPSSDFLLRRVRPIVEGNVFKIFKYYLNPDFAGGKVVLQDAYLDAQLADPFQIKVGKFKTPFGIERLQSGTDLLFAERALPNNLVPNRDLGLDLHGELFDGVLNYDAAILNGVADGGSSDGDINDDKEFAGRLFAAPFKNSKVDALQGLGVGAAVTVGDQTGALPSFKTPGQAAFFKYVDNAEADGRHSRVSPQAAYYWGPLGILAEWVYSEQAVATKKALPGTFSTKTGLFTPAPPFKPASAEIANNAWQVAASWVLTGEKASYKGVTPFHPFDLKKKTWGALELAARMSQLNVDDDAFSQKLASAAKSAKEAFSWALGLNWYLNKNVKVVLDYENTRFDGGSAGGADRDDEHVILTRFQIAF